MALSDFSQGLSGHLQKWIRDSATPGSGFDDLSNEFTVEQLDLFLCYQSFVFGYWYKFLEPLVTMEYVPNEVYFYSVWGFRDTYLLVLLRTFATKFRKGQKSGMVPGPDREALIRVLAAMYGGRSLFNPVLQPTNKSPGLVAILDNISIISKTLLRAPEDRDHIGSFCAVSLLVVGLSAIDQDELWAGETSELKSQDCISFRQSLLRAPPTAVWTLHPKRRSVKGQLPTVVLAVRCDGVIIGTISPNEADCALIRARDNRCGAIGRQDSSSADPTSNCHIEFFNATEEQFLSGVIYHPQKRGQVVVVQSYESLVMRYAAAAFYQAESHIVMTNGTLEASVAALQEQFKQLGLR